MWDFIKASLLLLWLCLIITALIYRRPLARKWDEFNRRQNVEFQIMRGRRDGRILRDTVRDMKRKGRL